MKLFSMLKIVVANVFRGPATRRYPYEVRPPFPGERGQIVMPDESRCIYCGICARKCPSNALCVERKPDKKWRYERFKCILCGACVEACPKKCLEFRPRK